MEKDAGQIAVENFGMLTAYWREDCGMSRAELAKKAGVSKPTIRAIEKNQRNLTVYTAALIADALGITVGEMIGEGD